jgi:hypothetical protein
VLDDAVMELKEQDREAILLRYNRGLRLAEIGARLRLTENAVQKRLDRAVEQLRSNLARRGITSTATALAIAFEQQNAVAVPAGLAGASAKAALAGAVGAAGVAAGLGVSTFMLVTKLQLGIAVAVTAAMATATAWRYRETSGLPTPESAMVATPTSQGGPTTPAGAAVSKAGVVATSSRGTVSANGVFSTADQGVASGGLWASLSSDNLVAMTARLRAAGFTAPLVRGIMTVVVNEKFERRRNELLDAVSTPFWKREVPSPLADEKIFAEYGQILRDRSNTLRELLTSDFFDDLVSPGLQKQFGDLPRVKAEAARRIEADYADLAAQVRSAAQGILLPEDRKKLDYLESQRQADLKDLLTPGELAEYQLRTSPLTRQLRLPMTLMNANEEEFRAIYEILAPITSATVGPAGAAGMGVSSAKPEVGEQLKGVLGEERYADSLRYSNPDFQRLYRVAEGQGVGVEAMVRAFNVRDSVAQESTRILADASLAEEQKRIALRDLAQNARGQIVAAVGEKAGNAYTQSAIWLLSVERGGAVSFAPDGSWRVTGSLPPARPATGN